MRPLRTAWVSSRFGTGHIERALAAAGFALRRQRPDIVLAYGGDGTVLEAERFWPGVLKLAVAPAAHGLRLRRLRHCPAVPEVALPAALRKLRAGRYRVRAFQKIEGVARGGRGLALNEIAVRNVNPARALRFSLSGRGAPKGLRIGDGIVAATAYGSTAYYRALGHEPFRSGFRVAGNNALPAFRPFALRGRLVVTVLREHAWFLGDNNPVHVFLKPGDRVTIRPAPAGRRQRSWPNSCRRRCGEGFRGRAFQPASKSSAKARFAVVR